MVSEEAKREMKELRKSLDDVKEAAAEEGVDIGDLVEDVKEEYAPEPTLADLDPEAYEMGRKDAFERGFRLPAFPGVEFTGAEAVKMYEEMYGPKPAKVPEKVLVELSDEDAAAIAKKYFRVDLEGEGDA